MSFQWHDDPIARWHDLLTHYFRYFSGSLIPRTLSCMSTPGGLFRPYQKLVKIQLLDRECEVPENNMVLRALQYLATEGIAYGRFCWNEECQYCRIVYDTGEGTSRHTALACKMMIKEGIRIHEISTELRYCLRDLKLQCGPSELVKGMTKPEE